MTSKELAKQLGLSEAAVSLALNNRPGVSTKTRNRVKEAATAAGMDFSSRAGVSEQMGSICLIFYRRNGAVLADTSFFSELTEGVEQKCREVGFRVSIQNIYSITDLERTLQELSHVGTDGAVLFGTEMREEDFAVLSFTDLPIVLLDNHFLSTKIDSIQINNIDGAYSAANYLIKRRRTQPGYLSSSYPIRNFSERRQGFNQALIHNGMSPSATIVHTLAPSIDGAYSDMMEILERKDPLAQSYFADNDLIAIGALRAFKAHGFRIPEDIALIGFDDIPMCDYTEPGLTTIHVPKRYMGMVAVERLVSLIEKKAYYPVNISISPHLVTRATV